MRLRNLIRKSPKTAVAISAFVGFLLSTILNVSQLVDRIEKFTKKPYVNMSVHSVNLNSMTVDVPVNTIMKIPDYYLKTVNPPTIKWRSIPIKAEFVNPRHEPMAFRNLRLVYLEGDMNLNACKKNKGGFYTWIIRSDEINPDNALNVPITINTNEAKTFNIDFLTVAFIPETAKLAEKADFDKFTAFCLRWSDQNGRLYLSNVYHPLK